QDGRFMQVNRSLAQMLGCSEEDLLNLTIFDITHPEDVADSRSRYQELIRAETDTYRFEKRYIRKDGEVVWADVSVSAIRGPDGVYEATIAVISDITRRKRAEEQLAESEERFRLAFENANIGVCMVDAQGRLLRVNDQLCEIWGYNRSELEGMTVNDITHPEDQELGRRFIERASSGEVERDEFEKRYIHKNGRVVWGKVSSSLVRDEQGNPLYFISHVQDVTERRRAEHVERRLVTAIDQATEGVLITDPHGTIQYVNPGLEQMTGYGREELIGRTPRILKSGEHDTQFYRRLWDTIKAGKTWTGRFTNRRKDGRLYYEDATISPVKDPSGKIVNFVAVKRDITEHLEISKQL
ncbi:MAG: PAS domain S-box protein, partial [Deltaproteobacteria bacterium]|nr:PAS domain S-box protein [Deltaproteobacteria bacterium]